MQGRDVILLAYAAVFKAGYLKMGGCSSAGLRFTGSVFPIVFDHVVHRLGEPCPAIGEFLTLFPAGAGEVVDKLDFAAIANFEAGSVIAIAAFGEGDQFPVGITGLQALV